MTLPIDIPWKRLAYSVDMVDTFMDVPLPPKWRSSIAVFYHEVPEEETRDNYPDRRIVFIKVTASITGFSADRLLGLRRLPSSEVEYSYNTGDEGWWRSVACQGFSPYFPCYGAIMQISVYPHNTDIEGLPIYSEIIANDQPMPPVDLPPGVKAAVLVKTPYIMDFEPKRREVFESRADTDGFLAGSTSKLNTGKSHTNTHSVSAQVSAGFAGVEASLGYQYTNQDVTYTNKEWAREKRESFSHTTNLNQIYSLFDGYHLGTNRAMFVMQPRPHMVNTDFNLIDGIRKLEGIQDIFLVVSIPKSNKGFCVQARLDTGHILEHKGYTVRVKKESEMTVEDYEKTPEMLELPLHNRDLSMEGMVVLFNSYNNLEEDEYRRHMTTVDVVERELVITFMGREIGRIPLPDEERRDEELETILADIKNRFFGAPESYLEKLYVIYDRATQKDMTQMFMTGRSVQNCAVFDNQTGHINPTEPGVMSCATNDEPKFNYEIPTAYNPHAVSATSNQPNSAAKSNYCNQVSASLVRQMVSAYDSGHFDSEGVLFDQTRMFKTITAGKLANMHECHPANIKLSNIKGLDKKTIKMLGDAGIHRIKDLFKTNTKLCAQKEKLPFSIISDIQKRFVDNSASFKKRDPSKQEPAVKK